MHGFKGNLLKIILVMLFGLATFWPTYGLAFVAFNIFPTHQIPVIIFAAIWFILFTLFLPIALNRFQQTSVVGILVIFIAGLVAAHSFIDITSLTFWLTWGAAAAFFIFGWLLVSSPLWRFFHGVVAVQDQHTDEHHGG